MLTLAAIRQYAVGQQINAEVADQEIVLHYALALLNGAGLTGRQGASPGPLLFKGGTALRKCIFGSTGRFSQDIDFDVVDQNGFEAEVEKAFDGAIRTSEFVVYDLYLWAQRPFSNELARCLAVLKCWTDQRRNRPFDPDAFLNALVPVNFRWTDLRGLIPRGLESDQERICTIARTRL